MTRSNKPQTSRHSTPNTRAIAAHTLSPVITGRRSLSASLDSALNNVDPNEKGLLQELCMGSLRVYPRLAMFIKKLLAKPMKSKDSDITALIAIGLYQLDYMRTPDHAAINQTVEAAKSLNKPWAVKLINGVLRQYIRDKKSLEQALNGSMVFKYAHPQWFIDKLRNDWPAKWSDVLETNNQQPPITLRVNKLKLTRDKYLNHLKDAFAEYKNPPTITLCEHALQGITLTGSIDVPKLPGFNQGWFSVQDEAAQLAGQLLNIQDNQRILDTCSAPGGKATHICEEGENISLTCIESDSSRMLKVEENLKRLGHSATLIVEDANNVENWWDGEYFDRILIDAPCSATGVIRRHPDIKLLRREEDIRNLARLQNQILTNVWKTLAPGGLLVYATCSILKEENEHIVRHFVHTTSDAKHEALKDVKFGAKRDFGRQLFPNQDGHDGFYYARISKLL